MWTRQFGRGRLGGRLRDENGYFCALLSYRLFPLPLSLRRGLVFPRGSLLCFGRLPLFLLPQLFLLPLLHQFICAVVFGNPTWCPRFVRRWIDAVPSYAILVLSFREYLDNLPQSFIIVVLGNKLSVERDLVRVRIRHMEQTTTSKKGAMVVREQ